MLGSVATRSANATEETVTDSTALTLPSALRIGAGEVECDAVARHGHGDDDAGGTLLVLGLAGGIHDVLEGPTAVVHGGERGAHATLSVGQHLVHGLAPLDECRQSRDAEHVRADLRVEVAAPFVGCPRVRQHERSDRGRVQHGRDAQTLLEDLSRVRRHRTGSRAAEIGVVGTVRRPTHQRAVEVRRGHERHVVEVGAALERVVHHDLVSRSQPHAAREPIDHGTHRRGHRAQVHGDVLRLHELLPCCVEQGGRAVGPLLDVRAERGTPKDRTHLVRNALETPDQHRQAGGVEGHC